MRYAYRSHSTFDGFYLVAFVPRLHFYMLVFDEEVRQPSGRAFT
jgi:hypothetical protein